MNDRKNMEAENVIYPLHGFPFLIDCEAVTVIKTNDEKTKREFSTDNIISIVNILNYGDLKKSNETNLEFNNIADNLHDYTANNLIVPTKYDSSKDRVLEYDINLINKDFVPKRVVNKKASNKKASNKKASNKKIVNKK